MNNLKNIMELRGATAKELAKRSGVAVSLIRRTMNDPQVTPRQKTAEKLAGALGCNCAQIYATQPAAANDIELLTKRVDDAAQALVRALGEYSKTPIYSALTISTRETLTTKARTPYTRRPWTAPKFWPLMSLYHLTTLAPLNTGKGWKYDHASKARRQICAHPIRHAEG